MKAVDASGMKQSQRAELSESSDYDSRESEFVLLSVVMPCLNEERTVGACIDQARKACELMLHNRKPSRGEHSTVRETYEIIIADNGSTDASREIAIARDARLVEVVERGYGAALRGGFVEAKGKYIVMGDSDCSYDFGDIPNFISKLEEGYDLVMGNRFAGGIMPGAMPWHHRYIGNPILSGLGRLLYRTPCRDWHCGLRAFDRKRVLDLDLTCSGMEFASEMVIRVANSRYRIAETPTALKPDGRNRAPHLRSLRDGLRHLRILLIAKLFVFSVMFIGCSSSVDSPTRKKIRGELSEENQSLKIRDLPVTIEPISGLEDCVSDPQLATALASAIPVWEPPTVPALIHELLVWGKDCDFSGYPGISNWSGSKMTTTLLDDKLCKELTAQEGGDFIFDTDWGMRPVLSGTHDAIGYRAEGHFGQLLKVLAESGVESSHRVESMSGRVGSVRNMITDLLMEYEPGREQEFAAVAIALWLPPAKEWINKRGSKCNFELLLGELLIDPSSKACFGTHYPYAVATILRVNQQYSIVSSEITSEAKSWLRNISRQLEIRQLPEGGWDESWCSANGAKHASDKICQITVTGHHLEWISIVPDDLRPNEESVRKAVQALTRNLTELDELEVRKGFKLILPCSHAARAVSNLRLEDSFVALRNYLDAGRIVKSGGRFHAKFR